MGRLRRQSRRRGTPRFSIATTSARSGSGTTTACAWATADSRCARGELLEALQDPRIALVDVEDVTIGRTFRPLLEREHGIRFADEALADRFSFEAAYPIGKPFGFHGLFNFCRIVPPDEIAALRRRILRRDRALAAARCSSLRNCSALGQWKAAAAIGRRILVGDAGPRRGDATARAGGARVAAAPPAVGRNDPCPCGSGKKLQAVPWRAVGSADGAAASPIPMTLRRATRIGAHRQGDSTRAERGYRAALAAAPEHPLALHYLGVILYQRNRLDDALPLLERSATRVRRSPSSTTISGLRSRPPTATTRRSRPIAARSR